VRRVPLLIAGLLATPGTAIPARTKAYVITDVYKLAEREL
jgi:hypothetical protein